MLTLTTEKINKILEDEAVGGALTKSGLSKLVGTISELENEIDGSKKRINILTAECARKTSERDQAYTTLTQHADIDERERKVAEREVTCTRTEIELEFSRKQVVFLEKQNDMILRNAEIKKTINAMVPVHQPYNENTGVGGFTNQETSFHESTETQL